MPNWYQIGGPPGYQIGADGPVGFQIGHGGHAIPFSAPPLVRQNYGDYPHELYPAMRGVGDGIDQSGAYGQVCGCGSCQAEMAAAMQPPVSLKAPTEMREFPLGFDSHTDVGPGATVGISTDIQAPFRGKRLVIDPDIASYFFINTIFVGIGFQGASTINLPGGMFVPGSLVPLQLDTAQIGNKITLNVTNRSGGGHRFLAGMIGDVLR